jgi:hypothetical protein
VFGESEGRLPAELWIKAHIRRCIADGIPAAVVHRGEKNSGMLILKINQLEAGVRVLSQTRDMEGAIAWMPALGGKLVADAEADAYIERAVKRDPDAWVVEIEARDGRHPFEGKEL